MTIQSPHPHDPVSRLRAFFRKVNRHNERHIELYESDQMGGAQLDEQHRALLRMGLATDRFRAAQRDINRLFLPEGSGATTEQVIAEYEAAWEEFRAAKQDMAPNTPGTRAEHP